MGKKKKNKNIAAMMLGGKRPGQENLEKLYVLARKDLDRFRGYEREIVNPNPIMRNTEEGIRHGIGVFRQIENDDQAGADLKARQLIVRSFPWNIVVDSDEESDQEQANQLKREVEPIIRKLLIEAQDAMTVGFSVTEKFLHFNPDTGRYEVKDVEGLYQENISFLFPEEDNFTIDETLTYSADWQMALRTETGQQHSIPRERVVLAVFDKTKNNLYGRSIFTAAFWPWWFKKHGFLFWSQFLEKFGMPTAVGEVPPNLDPQEEAKFLDTLESIQSRFAVTIPEGWKVELLEATRSGNMGVYKDFIDVCNRGISKAILMTVLTTNEALHGTRAHAESQNDLMMEAIHDDALWLGEVITGQVVTPIAEWNYSFSVPPRFVINFESEDISKEAAERDELVQRMVPVPIDQIREKYNIAKPEDDETLVTFAGQVRRWGDIKEATEHTEGTETAAGPRPMNKDNEEKAGFAEGEGEGSAPDFDALLEDEESYIDQSFAANREKLSGTVDTGQLVKLLEKAGDYDQACDLLDGYRSTRGPAIWEQFLTVGRLMGEYSVKKQIVAMEKAGAAASFAESGDLVKYDEAAFRKLRPKAAIKWFRKKIAVTPKVWKQIADDSKHAAFYISQIEDLEHVKYLKEKMMSAMAVGKPYKQFAREIVEVLGEPYWNASYMKTAFYTNTFSALAVQSQTALLRVTDRFPFWRYSGILDGKIRDSHAAMHGVVARHDDPLWSTWYPPNGYNCRCRITIATEAMYQAGRELQPNLQPDEGWATNPLHTNRGALRDLLRDKEEYGDQLNGRLHSQYRAYIEDLKLAREEEKRKKAEWKAQQEGLENVD